MLTSSRALRTWGLTLAAMIAFASNSLLCRSALRGGHIDPVTFTSVRLLAGAAVLLPIAIARSRGAWLSSIPSALALFAYAAAFSVAYLKLSTGLGALVLFGMVQMSMLAIGRLQGQRLQARQTQGVGVALAGLVALTLPLGSALGRPPSSSVAMMAVAGIAWGIYSVRGRGVGDPVASTARNFVWTVPMVALWWWAEAETAHVTTKGLLLAVTSGAIASGMGYVIWYAALRGLQAFEAALVQIPVPLLAALGGVWLMGEVVTLRLALSGVLILSGIAWAIARR